MDDTSAAVGVTREGLESVTETAMTGSPSPETAPTSSEPAPRSPMTSVRGLVQALRLRQWSKNVLIFVAPAAAGVLGRRTDILHAVAAFGVFCIAASGTYLVNDVVDAEADRFHPEKRHRPIASRRVSPIVAIATGVALIALAIGSAWFVARWELCVVIGIYSTVTIAYTLRLKREPVVELAAVASGFVLRAIAGGVAVHVPLSNWFLVVTSFGALFVVTGKRVAEHDRLGDSRSSHRAVLDQYTPTFLHSTLTLTASVTVTAYCLWAFERAGLVARAGHHFVWIQLTVIPIIIGVLHVLRLLDAKKGGAPEELVLHDHLLQILAVIWVALFLIGLYG